jgi:TonB family protein
VLRLQASNTCTEGQYISAGARSYDGLVTQPIYYRCVRNPESVRANKTLITQMSAPMPPTAKDVDVTNPNSTGPGVRPASAGAQEDNSGKPQPVPLEVPVTVNGARTVEGSDKREPFSETSQTVLVFGNGAVIRLASSVAAGQLLFLTNDKTKKEVVCQVVKSKNYRNVSGYVELEFTEPVPGFWGMRFPGERVTAPPSAPAPVATAKPAAPAANSIPLRVAPKPVSAQPAVQAPVPPPVQHPAPAAPVATFTSSGTISGPIPEIKPTSHSPRASEPKSVTILPSSSHQRPPISSAPNPILPKAPGLTDGFGSGLTSTARPSETKPPASVAPKVSQTPSIAQPSSDVLRRESERLQEQLASMLFAAEVPATPVKAVPVPPAATSKPPVSELPGKVVEMAKPQTSVQSLVQPPAQILPQAPAANAKITLPKSAPLPSQSPMDDEELKIPSWLEPLARNAATQAQNEPAAKEAPPNTRRVVEFEVQDVSAPPEAQGEEAPTPAEQVFGTHFSEEADIEPQNGAKGNNKGVLIGAIAAGILVLVAVGVWHGRQSSAPAQQTPVTTAVTTAPAAAAPSAAQPAPATRNATGAPTPNRSNINSEPVAQTHNSSSQAKANSPSITPASDVTKISPDKNIAAELSAYKKLAEPPAPVKRPGLVDFHLAAPKANRTAVASDLGNADGALTMNPGEGVPTENALGGGLAAGNSSQPVAPAVPLPIGGDVKPARLLSSPPPAYPALAKTQRIQGAVRVDALVDATGRVSSMKVISGPALLHQAALDSLRQWKYQPATLDGKPVPMHLTVTVQFRLQ